MTYPVHGAGLGLRRELLDPAADHTPSAISFFEVAPENWIGLGGRLGRKFRALTEKHDFVTHGLSLSLGSPAPLDEDFIYSIREFLDAHGILYYTEHLSYCSDHGHLYDLMPIPFTEKASRYVAERISRTQDILGRQIGIENVSYYAAPGKQIEEIEFLLDVLQRADCRLLLDINNIYVNSINHGYDAEQFLKALPRDRIAYAHVAGHYVEAEDLRVDTHGSAVCDPVWQLLEKAYEYFGVFPTLLERDFNIPPLADLSREVERIVALQDKWANTGEYRIA